MTKKICKTVSLLLLLTFFLSGSISHADTGSINIPGSGSTPHGYVENWYNIYSTSQGTTFDYYVYARSNSSTYAVSLNIKRRSSVVLSTYAVNGSNTNGPYTTRDQSNLTSTWSDHLAQ